MISLTRKYLIPCLMAIAATGCGVNELGPEPTPGPDGTDPGTGTTVYGYMADGVVGGIATDPDGNPLAGVTVTSGTSSTQTTSSGFFSLQSLDVNNGRILLHFSKPGYFPVTRTINETDLYNGSAEIVMVPNQSAIATTATFDSSDGYGLKASGLEIGLPANGFKNAATGEAYSGTVKAEMVYLSPDNEQFDAMMPGGDLAAERTDGSYAMLLSYGMTCVNLTDADGNRLQISDGSEATLSFPIPESLTDRRPETIPLWSFDEGTGLWKEEGTARLDGDRYVGTARHFSWVNLDYPEEQARVNGYVVNSEGTPLRNLKVKIGQITVKTNEYGYFDHDVMANERFEVTIDPRWYGNYKDVYTTTVGPLEPGEMHTIPTIVLPVIYTVSGTIVNQGGGLPVASVWITYGQRSTEKKTSGADGSFVLYAPDGYAGDAILHVGVADGSEMTVPFTLSGTRNVLLGAVIINSNESIGGRMNITLPDGQGLTMLIPGIGDDELGGVVVIGNEMGIIYPEEYDMNPTNLFDLYCKNFNLNNNTFTDALASAQDPSGIAQGTVSGKAERRDNRMNISFSGSGLYASEQTGQYYENVGISASNVGIGILYLARIATDFTPDTSTFPAFTPTLGTPAPVALVVTDSPKLGKGGQLFYNGSLNDFKNLVSQAESSGLKKLYVDYDDESYAEAMFMSGQNVIMIDYQPGCPNISAADADRFSILDNELDCSIEVMAFSGGTLDYNSLLYDDYAYDSSRAPRIRRKALLPRRRR